MLKRLTLSALLGSALALAAADVTLPCAFAAGQLTRFDRTAEALPFVDFDKAAALAAAPVACTAAASAAGQMAGIEVANGTASSPNVNDMPMARDKILFRSILRPP